MPDATINGCQHHWEDTGDGTPIVMLHGAAGSGLSFEGAASQLAAAGFRVVVPDMRAMGRSEHVDDLPPSAWVDDLLGLLDHLGIDKAIVHGVSLGSRVALRFAIDHPGRTLGAVLDAFIIANDPAGNAQLNQGFNPDTMPEERKEAAKRQHGGDWAAVLANYFRIRNKPDLQKHFNLRPFAAQCQVPVLIVRGDNVADAVHPFDHAIEGHKTIPNSKLAIYPNGASTLTTVNPSVFVQVVSGFAAGLSDARAST